MKAFVSDFLSRALNIIRSNILVADGEFYRKFQTVRCGINWTQRPQRVVDFILASFDALDIFILPFSSRFALQAQLRSVAFRNNIVFFSS